MNSHLSGQTALVTGASRGIGHAIAMRLGRAGARVIGTATSGAGASALETTLQTVAPDSAGYALALDEEDAVPRLGEYLAQAGLKPTILVNNAGITRDNLMLRLRQQEWDEVMRVNLDAAYLLSKLCLRDMVKARYGRIINLSSVVALAGGAGQANYAAAKAGIIGFSRALAREVGNRGITVNCIAPGYIETDMTDAISAERRAALFAQIPAGRFGQPEDVAAVVEFIASAAAAYITGEVINVNGGMYMG